MGWLDDVATDDVIEATWGNSVRDQLVISFADTSTRDSQWSSPPEGALCVTTDSGTIWQRRGSSWTSLRAAGAVLDGAQTYIQSNTNTGLVISATNNAGIQFRSLQYDTTSELYLDMVSGTSEGSSLRIWHDQTAGASTIADFAVAGITLSSPVTAPNVGWYAVKRTTDLTVPYDTDTAVEWSSEWVDQLTGSYSGSEVLPDDAAPGWYLVTAMVTWDGWEVDESGSKRTVETVLTTNDDLSGEVTVDGFGPTSSDLVLVLGQTLTTNNGVYVTASGAWSRSTLFDAGSELVRCSVRVKQFSYTYAGARFASVHGSAPTIGTTPIKFIELPSKRWLKLFYNGTEVVRSVLRAPDDGADFSQQVSAIFYVENASYPIVLKVRSNVDTGLEQDALSGAAYLAFTRVR